MREDQRSRALRLIELFDAVPGEDWLDNAAALLRELAAERAAAEIGRSMK